MSVLTPYHAKYFAFELIKQVASDSVEKLASTLLDAQVDFNPHQVEAALFAFRSPLSKEAILTDEVGLGKTIEAGLVISQKWAEQKRKILFISPANLRKQWGQELQDKFFLQALILLSKSFLEADCHIASAITVDGQTVPAEPGPHFFPCKPPYRSQPHQIKNL
ncbi:Type III restriction-modification system methylation subunit [Lunatimonas lonarensis]|uniref:Type III restriction-modification system methylation subunit n=1 Tax=Lunatimonas lonarensis TaxID=1232681 RepID=R7ZU21_9BACT|nr:SNF2-related protein [Lunatimonas lonarensis]EON77572.1 Type III restriction-modification system methylation subunit [Lunatimonas lonarensis]